MGEGEHGRVGERSFDAETRRRGDTGRWLHVLRDVSAYRGKIMIVIPEIARRPVRLSGIQKEPAWARGRMGEKSRT